MNLINKPFEVTGNYVCTWETQETVAEAFKVEGNNIPEKQRNVMSDKYIFMENSLYHIVPEKYRSGLIFLLDDGWDVPYNIDAEKSRDMFGSVILDEKKFPNYGNTPTERLKTLSEKVKSLGYAGLGLWISPQIPYEGDNTTLQDACTYWSERAKWCSDAGVLYWKVDWGKHQFNREYLEMMTECVKEFAPDLRIEHAVGNGPFGATVMSPDEPKALLMRDIFEVSDYFRTYDVLEPFVDDASLCRLDALLSNSSKDRMKKGVGGYVNIESSPLIAAGLSVNMGIMYGGGNVDAVLNWQRLSPPMSIFDADYIKSNDRLIDYKFGDVRPVNWTDFYGKDYEISAPAVTARGTKLPSVEKMETPPFVMVSCNNKTKAYCIATLHRVLDPNNHYISLANITVYPKMVSAPIGIFGYYKNLTVEFSENIPKDSKVYAQCLLDDEAFEITEKVIVKGNKIILDGKLLRLWGRSKNALGYKEDPALVIQVIGD